jgi:hypothetical protein
LSVFMVGNLFLVEECFVLCLDDRWAEKFMDGGRLEMYGLVVTPGDGRPRKSGWYKDDWHK